MLQIVDTQWKDHLCSIDLRRASAFADAASGIPWVDKELRAVSGHESRIEEDIVRYLFLLRTGGQRRDGSGSAPRSTAGRAAR